MKTNFVNILMGAAAVLILLSLSMFMVDQRQTVIVLQLGEMVGVKTAPGLYFKSRWYKMYVISTRAF